MLYILAASYVIAVIRIVCKRVDLVMHCVKMPYSSEFLPDIKVSYVYIMLCFILRDLSKGN